MTDQEEKTLKTALRWYMDVNYPPSKDGWACLKFRTSPR